MRKHGNWFAGISVTLIVGVIGLLGAANVQSVGADSVDTGPKAGLRMIDEEIALLRQNPGATEHNPVLQTLRAERARLTELATRPALPPPDPAEVARILSTPPSPPLWDSGEIECEGSLGTKDIEFKSQPRCIAIPRASGNLLTVWLSGDGWALVGLQLWQGSDNGIDFTQFELPVIDDLQSATVELVDQEIHVTSGEKTIIVPTRGWFPETGSGLPVEPGG